MALDRGAPTDAPSGVTLDVWPHPLTAEDRRDATLPVPATLGDAIDEAGLGSAPVRAWIDGREVEAELLDREPDAVALTGGEIVTLRRDLQRGLLRNILQIALIAAAVFIPPLLGFAAGTVGAAFVSAGIMVAGSLLINALVPPEIPRLDAPGADRGTPVYSLTGGANRARPYAPLMVVLGSHRVFPDLAAAEYSTFEDGEQFLHQIFDFGLGDIDVGALNSGASTLAGFDGVTEYRALGGKAITEIAGNVDTTAGAELTDTDWVKRTATNCNVVAVDFVARVFKIDEKGAHQDNSLTVEVRVSASGQSTASDSLTITNDDQGQVRRTVRLALPVVTDWTVEVRRTAAPSEEDRTYDDVAFTSMRAFQPDTATYEGRNRIGVRLKASAQLQGRLDRISGTVDQKVPVWDGNDWTANAKTSNPAWIFRWWALGLEVGGRLVAGYGLPLARIDDSSIKAWGAWCDAQSLECNYVLDRERSVDDVLRLIAKCGRASPSWQTGKLGVVFDEGGLPATALVHPGNIVQGSFGIEWAGAQLAQEIAVRYVEPRLDWQWNTIRRTVPGVTGTPANSVTHTLEGVTSARQAASEAGLLAARQDLHRRRMAWEMSAEGLALRRGQVVHVTHSLVDGGETGRLKAGTRNEVTLDREVTLGTGTNWIMLRLAGGAVHTSRVTRAGGGAGASARLALGQPMPEAPDSDGPAHDVLWRLYDGAAPPLKAKIIATEPLSDRAVRIVAIDEDPDYYAAATRGLNVNVTPQDHGPPEVLAITAANRYVRAGSGTVVEVEAVLTVAGAWEGAEIRVGRATAGSVRTVAQLQGDSLVARWIEEPRGQITITAIPFHDGGLHLSGALSIDHALVGSLYAIAPPTGITVKQVSDGTRVIDLTPPEDPDLAGIVIRYAEVADGDDDPEWGVMTPLHKGVLTSFPHETLEPEMGTFVFSARALSTAGEISMETRVTVTLTGTRIGGQQWSSGSGDPTDDTARDGAFYLDVDSGNLWQRQEGAWVKVSNVQAADGAQWYNGADAPGNNLGRDGDWYLQTGTGAVAGTVYAKAAGAWVKQFDIDSGEDGATWLSGTAEPAGSLGKVGDFYFRSANGYVYQKTAASTWSFLRDITGPAGVNGSVWHSTAGIPAASVGADGDFALNVRTNVVYQKAAGAWTEVANFSGADGDKWFTGSGAPANSLGTDGDWYFRTGQSDHAGTVYRKASGVWTKVVDIDDGADGATWYSGSSAPASNLGKVGDWYLRTTNSEDENEGYVYEKTDSTTWTFRHDLTGPSGADLPGVDATSSTISDTVYRAFYTAPSDLIVGIGTYVIVAFTYTQAGQAGDGIGTAVMPYATSTVPARVAISSEGRTSRSDPIFMLGYWSGQTLFLRRTPGVNMGSAEFMRAAIISVAEASGGSIPRTGGTGGQGRTESDFIYIRATSAPGAPSGGTTSENHLPSGWSRTRPTPTATQDVYRAERTRTYDAQGDFDAATAWSGVIKVADRTGTTRTTTNTDSIYIRATSAPGAPSGGTTSENHLPSGWSRTQPTPTATESVYRAQRVRTYSNGVFQSATAWGSVTTVAAKTGSSYSIEISWRGGNQPSLGVNVAMDVTITGGTSPYYFSWQVRHPDNPNDNVFRTFSNRGTNVGGYRNFRYDTRLIVRDSSNPALTATSNILSFAPP